MDFAEDPLQPRLLLFLSVDVVGSTRYKNEESGTVQPWLPFFSEFYRAFPELLSQQGSKVGAPTLRHWKSLGDELLFYAELSHHRQARLIVETFLHALAGYRRAFRGKKGLPKYLNLKGTAWVAGFPVTNSIVFPAHVKTPDFIGPSMDIGFRLAHHSTPESMCVSVELAYLLAQFTSEAFNLRFETTVRLKGVLKERTYPLICINQAEAVSTEENALGADEHHLREATSSSALKLYCRKFIENCGRPLLLPFIDGDADFSARPPAYDRDLDAIRKIYAALGMTVGSEALPLETGTPIASSSDLKRKLGQIHL